MVVRDELIAIHVRLEFQELPKNPKHFVKPQIRFFVADVSKDSNVYVRYKK